MGPSWPVPLSTGDGGSEVLPPLGGMEDEEEEDANYGHGFMATGGSFGKVTPEEMIQGRKHLLEVERELLKIKLAREMVPESEEVTSSIDAEEGLEEGEVEVDKSVYEDEEFKRAMNGALQALREEQEEIRQVDALIGEVERERARKGKDIEDENFPVIGNTVPATFLVGYVAEMVAGDVQHTLAGFPKALGGNSNSKLVQTSRAQVTSIPSFSRAKVPSIKSSLSTNPSPSPSPFPPISSNSNLPPFNSNLKKTPIPSNSSPSLFPTKLAQANLISNSSSPILTGLTGQPLTSQRMNSKPSTPTLQTEAHTLPPERAGSGPTPAVLRSPKVSQLHWLGSTLSRHPRAGWTSNSCNQLSILKGIWLYKRGI